MRLLSVFLVLSLLLMSCDGQISATDLEWKTFRSSEANFEILVPCEIASNEEPVPWDSKPGFSFDCETERFSFLINSDLNLRKPIRFNAALMKFEDGVKLPQNGFTKADLMGLSGENYKLGRYQARKTIFTLENGNKMIAVSVVSENFFHQVIIRGLMYEGEDRESFSKSFEPIADKYLGSFKPAMPKSDDAN